MLEILTLAMQVFFITILAVDFVYTCIFWLGKERPHPFDRYTVLVGWLGFEAAAIAVLITL